MITWKHKTEKFENGEFGYIGKIKIFSIDYDSSNPPPNKYWLLTCFLPSLERFRMHFSEIEGEEGAYAGAEDLFSNWLKDAGLSKVGEK